MARLANHMGSASGQEAGEGFGAVVDETTNAERVADGISRHAFASPRDS
jgi:hypothetical protein